MKLRLTMITCAATLLSSAQSIAQITDQHGWIGTGTLETPLGTFEFEGGYPTEQAAGDLARLLRLNRAIETYLEQVPAVSWYNVWKGVGSAGSGTPNQVVIWESLMDSETLLLTGNSETVYGMAAIDLDRDGPVVLEVPAGLLGGVSDIWQAEIAGIGPTGLDRGRGGKMLFLPPGYSGAVPAGYAVARATTFRAVLGLRGFQVAGKTDNAVSQMKSIRIYPLSAAKAPPQMAFLNGSGQPINTIFPDTADFFFDLAAIVAKEPRDRIEDYQRFRLAEIGIESSKDFAPDSDLVEELGQAAQIGSAMARAQSFASTDPARLVYPDRRWEWLFVGGSSNWDSQGYVNMDRRAGFSYQAIGMSPAMVEKVLGQGSQYLAATRDASGTPLEGAKSYRLHLPKDIPVKNFWSVVVYDAQSRSMLQNGNRVPTISQFTGPVINKDGSVDLYFGPEAPAGKEKNWIRTVAGKGWFPLIRFYGPLQPFFDKTWKPDDIVAISE